MSFKNHVAAIGGFVRKAMGRVARFEKLDADVPRGAVVEALEGRQMLAADLTITAIAGITGQLVPGQLIAGTVTVRNIALSDAAGPTEAMVVLSTDKIIGNGDDIMIASVPTTALGAGKFSLNPFTATLSESIPDGKYYVGARADIHTNVVEFNEENNTFVLAAPVTVMRSTLSVTATPAKMAETGGKGTFTITRAGAPLTVPLSVDIVMQGTAVRGTDYVLKVGNEVLTSDTLTIPAKSGTVTVGVFAIGDSLIEGDEGVILSLYPSITSPPAYVINSAKSFATVTITDDEPSVKLTAATTKMAEDGSVTFTVTRSGGSNKAPLEVFFSTVGSAIRGTDYKIVSVDGKTTLGDSVTLGANVGSVTFKAVGIDDQLIEGEEGFGIFLIDSPGTPTYSINALNKDAHIKIIDNEPTVKLSTTATKMNEDSSATFTLSRTGGSNKLPLTVYFDTFGPALQGTDYKLVSMDGKTVFSNSVTMGANLGTVTFKAVGIDDPAIEGDENFTIHLANAPGDKTYIIDPLKHEGTVKIIDNEPSISLTTTTKITSETKGSATFTVTRTGGSTGSALDVYFTSFLSAIQGTDYTLVSADGKTTLSNMVTIPAKATSVTFKALVIDDAKIEGNENIGLYLEYAPGDKTYTINSIKNTVEVVLYDNEPEVSIKVLPDKTSETKGSVTYTVTRAFGATTAPLTVFFNTMGTAEQGKDYTLVSMDGKSTLTNSVTIPTGATSVSFKASIIDDSLIEGSETIVVQLSPGAGDPTYTINSSKNFANVTIADNEPTVSLVMVKNAVEGGAKGQFKFTRAGGNTASVLTVPFTLSGSATLHTDFTLATTPASANLSLVGSAGSVTFAAGVTSITVDVTGVSDAKTDENTETVGLSLVNNGSFALEAGKFSATLNISDAPPGPGAPMNVGRFGSSVTLSSFPLVDSYPTIPGFPLPVQQTKGTGTLVNAASKPGHFVYVYTWGSGVDALTAKKIIFTTFVLNAAGDEVGDFAGGAMDLVFNTAALREQYKNLSGKTIQFFAAGTPGTLGTFEARALLSMGGGTTKVTGTFKIV